MNLLSSVRHRIVETARALERAPDLIRHLTELELRVAQVELDSSDFDRDLGHVEAIVREHHMAGPAAAFARRRGGS